ncbi:hypothetical protein BH23GEM5_BH23GEM5_17970 [soil metagenome]
MRTWCSGGNGREVRQGSTNDAHRVGEGHRIGIARSGQRAQRRLVHQPPDREVGQQQTPRLLTDELGRLAAQHPLPALQVRLELVERRQGLPALMIQFGQLECGRVIRFQEVGDQAILRFGIRNPRQRYWMTRTGMGLRFSL